MNIRIKKVCGKLRVDKLKNPELIMDQWIKFSKNIQVIDYCVNCK